MKRCACCKEEKPVQAFSVDRKQKSGLDCYCRACKAEKRKNTTAEQWRIYHARYRGRHPEAIRKKWQRENAKHGAEKARRYRARHPERALESSRQSRIRLRNLVADFKRKHGCAVCGIDNPNILDLHHINGTDKIMAVSQLIARRGIKTIAEEMEKCRVLCANCHRREHYVESQ